MRTIIVTGATGFIGRYVVDKLLSENFRVIGTGRQSVQEQRENYLFIPADIREGDEVSKIFTKVEGIEGIVHLAADINILGNENTIKTNCIGTYNLALNAVKYKLKYFINLSSIPVIGVPLYLPITELHRENPNTLYHITKLASERIVIASCANYMRVLNMRISSPIGLGMNTKNYLSVLLNRCIQNEKIEVYGKGIRLQNYIDVRDVAQAIFCAIKSDRKGLYLIAGGRGVLNLELAQICKNITGASGVITIGRKEDKEEEYQWEISIEKAKKELGFFPKYSIEESIDWIYRGLKGDR